MSAGQPDSSKPSDPFEPFRGMRDAYLGAMAKTMVEAVNSEAYAKASGAMLDNSLTMAAPFRELLEKSMLQALQQLSLPSRQDIVVLAERFTNLEMHLDDIDASLDGFEAKSKQTMMPILEQFLLLNQIFANLVKRLDAVDAKLERLQKSASGVASVAKAPSPAAKTKKPSVTQLTAKPRVASKHAPVARHAAAKQKTRKGAR